MFIFYDCCIIRYISMYKKLNDYAHQENDIEQNVWEGFMQLMFILCLFIPTYCCFLLSDFTSIKQ